MSLFRLVAKIGIDASEFNAGLKKAESGVSASMATIGARVASAFSVAAIGAFIAKVANAAGEVGDLADQLGITTQEVQALQRAADHSGISFDKYAAALGKIRKLKADFANGDTGAAKTFASTGLNPNDSELSILQQIGGLSDAKAFEILDAKSAKLKNSLKDLSSIPPIQIISPENVDALDRAGDALGDIWRTLKAIGSVPIGATARAILDGSWVKTEPFIKHDALPIPEGRFKARDTGEFFGPEEMLGPTKAEANLQVNLRNQRRSQMPGQFSRIDMGDRANVGGFFGPNADLNRSMQRTLASMDQSLKTIEKSVSTTMNTQ